MRFLFVFLNYARRFLIVLLARFLFVFWPHSPVTVPLVGCPWTPERAVVLSLATWRLGLGWGANFFGFTHVSAGSFFDDF